MAVKDPKLQMEQFSVEFLQRLQIKENFTSKACCVHNLAEIRVFYWKTVENPLSDCPAMTDPSQYNEFLDDLDRLEKMNETKKRTKTGEKCCVRTTRGVKSDALIAMQQTEFRPFLCFCDKVSDNTGDSLCHKCIRREQKHKKLHHFFQNKTSNKIESRVPLLCLKCFPVHLHWNRQSQRAVLQIHVHRN